MGDRKGNESGYPDSEPSTSGRRPPPPPRRQLPDLGGLATREQLMQQRAPRRRDKRELPVNFPTQQLQQPQPPMDIKKLQAQEPADQLEGDSKSTKPKSAKQPLRFLSKDEGQNESSTDPQNKYHNTKSSRILYTTVEEIRSALLELAIYLTFLFLTTCVVLSVRSTYMFYFNQTMLRLFTQRELIIAPSVTISFEKVITKEDFWDYMKFNFLVTLHGNEMPDTDDDGDDDDNGKEDEERPPQKPDDEIEAPEEIDENQEGQVPNQPNGRRRRKRSSPHSRYKREIFRGSNDIVDGRLFMNENLLLGPPRMRQIRVKKDSCYVNDAFIRYFNTCYAPYSKSVEDMESSHFNTPYHTMTELSTTPIWAQIGHYRSGGYIFEFTYDRKVNELAIDDLRKENWIDRATRMCLVEFNLYNGNTHTYQIAKFLVELPATGGVVTMAKMQTVKRFSFITDRNMTHTVFYICWYVMIVFYTVSHLGGCRKRGFKKHFKSIFNAIDILILIMAYLAVGYNVWHTLEVHRVNSLATRTEGYQSLDNLALWNTIYVDMMALLTFLCWLKIFKFISFNKTLVQFTTTLRRCSKDLAGFSLMFSIVFLAYAQLGLLLFGTKHPDFRDFITSILTMTRMILGDFQYEKIESANRVLGPIYFLSYILLVFFILLNMFLAIIMETYNSVKGEITAGRSQLGNYVIQKVKNFVYFILHCGKKRRVVRGSNIRDHRPDDHDDNMVQFETPADPKKQMSIQNQNFFNDPPPDVDNKELYRLNNRITLLEDILEQILTNMDNILERVERESKKNKNQSR